MPPLFKPLQGPHPGESPIYRETFRRSATLVFVYRLGGTVAGLVGVMSTDKATITRPNLLVAVVGLYVVGSSFVALRLVRFTRFHLPFGLGRGERRFLDASWAPPLDVLTVVVASLLLATAIDPAGSMPWAEVLQAATISTILLWTGRYGGKLGVALIVLLTLTPLAGAILIEHASWGDVNYLFLASRAVWGFVGWGIALGAVGMMVRHADVLTIAETDQQLLVHNVMMGDVLSSGLRDARRQLRMSDDPAARQALVYVQRSLDVAQEIALTKAARTTVAGCVVLAVSSLPKDRRISFRRVDGGGGDFQCERPDALISVVRTLCMNVLSHRDATVATIRWKQEVDHLTLTVVDDDQAAYDEREILMRLHGALSESVRRQTELRVTQISNGTRREVTLPFEAHTRTAEPIDAEILEMVSSA